MRCIDPEEARRADEGGDDAESLRAGHARRCPACAELAASITRFALDDGVGPHPSSQALARLADRPDELTPKLRSALDAHVAACDACRNALRAAGQALPSVAAITRGWALRGIAAAAAILLAILVWSPWRDDVAGRNQEPVTASLVLSAARGEASARIPKQAELIDLHLILGEAVADEAMLDLTWIGAAGERLATKPHRVRGLDENDWPRLLVPIEAVPHGAARLEVRTPSGRTIEFRWPERE